MKRLIAFGIIGLALAACDEAAMSAGPSGPSRGLTEQLVIGSRMSFADCQARGGVIIRDQGSAMVACDPSVKRAPAPEPDDEFNHPTDSPKA